MEILNDIIVKDNLTGIATSATKWATARTLSLTGDVTGSVSMDGSGNASIVTNIVDDSHAHVVGNVDGLQAVLDGINPQSGTPRSNLGAPSTAEMAVIDTEFNNKTWFYNPIKLKFEYTNDGTTWIEQSYTAENIKNLVSGNSNGSMYIPRDCLQYRITIVNDGNYVYLNALYMYFSTSGNSTKVQMFKKRNDSVDWVQHTSSNVSVSSWPGHLYLPFYTIPWSQSATSGHYNDIRILFIPTWGANTNTISLNGLEIWGGYPAGIRTIYSHDSDKNVTFPAYLKATKFVKHDGQEMTSVTVGTVQPTSGWWYKEI